MAEDFHKTFRMAAQMDVNRFWAANCRIKFLGERIADLQTFVASNTLNPLSLGVALIWIEGCKKEIVYLEEKKVLIRKKPEALMRLTDDQIQIANNYPIESLIDFNNGKATAWCHSDKTPSLTIWKKGNKAKCWVCDKFFSPIDVLMQRDGLNFVDAVKFLN